MFRRKWLASVVSVVMVFAFMPISSFALDDFGVQPAENTEVSVPDAEPAAESDTEATVEDEQAAEPAPVEETTEDVSEESEQQETESAEEVKDESDDSAKMPAQEFSGTASNGIKVSVSAPEGAFPEGTEMKLKAVGHDRAVSLLEGEAEDVVDANGVDITFFKDGREIQPQKAIKVSLSNANVEGETFNVYHVADNGAVDRVSGASSNGASFSASHFSIYIVSGTGESETPYTATYTFKNGDEVVDTQIVKNGETLKKPEAPEKAGYKFTGWFNGEEEFTAFGESIAVTENSEVTLTAGFQEAHYVFFKHPNGGVYTTKEGVKGDVITTTDVVINISATSSAYKWYTDSECTDEVTNVTLENSNIYLYTKAETGHWITFDSNGGSFVSSQFVNASDVTVQPANPTRMGYTFNGWKLNGSSFSFGSQLDKNVTLTASWTANSNTKYTVIHWQENANDDKYSFKESETKTGTTGAETAAAAKTYNGFTAQTITQKTIAGDGSTIVNVYYKRNVYVVKFYTNTGSEWWPNWTEDTSKKITAKHGAYIGDKWPGGAWYVKKGSNTSQAWLENMPLGGASFYGHTTGYYVSTANYFVENKKGDDVVLDHSDAVRGDGWLKVTSEDKYSLTGFTYQDSITIKNKTYESTKNGGSYNNAEFYYSRNSYNIVFINNGTTDRTVSKKYEASIANENYIPENPASIPDAYTFGGWYDNELCQGDAYVFDGKTMPAGNITLYAKWTAPEVKATIHVKVAGDSVDYTISYGEKLNPDWLSIPEDIPEGATFVGWGTRASDGSLQIFDTNQPIYSYVELFPIVSDYSRNYSVVYDANGGTGTVTDSDKYLERSYAEVKSAKDLTAPSGKVFLGWNTASDGTGTMYQPGNKIRIGTSDITLYAQWGDKVAAASIIYHSNYPGISTQTQSVQNLNNNGKTQIRTIGACGFNAPTGYVFDGWATSNDGAVVYAAGASVLVDNLSANVLYAKWKPRNDLSYTINYYKDSVSSDNKLGETVTEGNQTYGAKVSLTDAQLNKEKPVGYQNGVANPSELTIGVGNNNINVVYEKDSTQTHSVSAQVEYYYGDTLADAKAKTAADATDEIVTATGWIGEETTVTVTPNTTDKFVGYKYDSTEGNLSYSVAAKAETDTETHVVKVYYVKDDSQKHSVSAQVKYYYGDTLEAAKAKATPDATDEVKTETGWIGEATTVTVEPNITNKFTGYTHALTDGALSYTVEAEVNTDETTHIVKVYYVKDATQTHSVSAQVEYYYGDTFEAAKAKTTADAKDEVKIATGWIGEETTVTVTPNKTNKFTGYKYDSTEGNLSYSVAAKAETDKTTHIVKVYYVKDADQTHSVSAQVKYYYGDTLADAKAKTDADATDAVETATGWIGEETTVTVTPNTTDKFVGYKYDSTDGALSYSVEAKANTDKTTHIVKVYYVKDDSQKHSVKAQVEYYYGDTLADAKAKTAADATDEIVTATGWIGEKTTVTVTPNTTDKFVGYKYDSTDGALSYSVAAGAATGTETHVVKVYYVKDADQKHSVSAQVKYYYGDTLADAKAKTAADATDEIVTATGWIGEETTVTVTPNTTDKFVGYKYDSTEGNLSYSVAAKAETDTETHVVKVYYVKDADQKHSVSAQVKYYYGDTLAEAKAKTDADATDEVVTATGWIGEETTVTVTPNTTDKFVGYKYDSTEGNLSYSVAAKAETDTETHVVKVYYVKDADQKHSVSAQVKYYYGDTLAAAKEKTVADAKDNVVTETGWIGEETTVTVTPNTTNKFTGYEYDSTVGDLSYSVAAGAATGTETHVVKVYYVKDADQKHSVSAQVKYYYGDTLAAAKEKTVADAKDNVVTETGWIGEETTVTVTPNTTDKFVGYKYDSTDGALSYSVAAKAETDTETHVVKVYYVKDADQKHSVSAQVKYYYGDTLADAKAKTDADATDEIVTATGWIGEETTVTVTPNTTDKFVGYKYDSTEGNLSYSVAAKAETDKTTHIVKVYYVKDAEQTHSVSAQVKYYYGDTLAAAKEKTVADAKDNVVTETGWIGEETTVTVAPNATNKFTGYKYAETEGALTYSVAAGAATDATTHVVKVYYVPRNDLEYTINYYKDSVSADNKLGDTVTVGDQTYGDKVSLTDAQLNKEKPVGYQDGVANPSELTIGVSGNNINVVYAKRNDLSYTINYYKDSVSADNKLGDTVTVRDQTYGDKVSLTDTQLNKEKPVGYQDGVANPSELTIGVSGNNINVVYAKRNDLSYTINYYKDSVSADNKLGDTVTVGDQTYGDKVSLTDAQLNKEKPVGYQDGVANPSELTIGVSGNNINVVYAKRNDLSYTINYYKDSVSADNKLGDTVTVGDQTYGDKVSLTDAQLNKEKPVGYQDGVANPSELTIGVSGNNINVVYAKRNDLSYTINYYKDSVSADNKLGDTVTVGDQTYGDKVSLTDTQLNKEKPVGYQDGVANPSELTIGVSGNNINVVYAKRNDLSYTINYYKDSVSADNKLGDTVTVGDQTYGDKVSLTDAQLNKEKPVGYQDGVANPSELTIGVSGNNINVVYAKRNDLSYTVEYLEKGTNKALKKAKVAEGQTFGDKVTETAVRISGYKVDGKATQSLEIGVDSNVITFYYTAIPTPATPGEGGDGNGDGGNGGTAATDNTPAPAADNTVQIEDQETPKANLDLEKDGAWALLNLLLSLLACIMSIALIITYFMKKREDEEEQNADYAASRDEEERKLKKKGLWRVISIAWAILMLIVFFLTEDMSLPMIWVDKWTILMVVMTIIQAGIMFMSRKKYEDEDEDNPQMA